MFRKVALFSLVIALCVIILGSYVRLSEATLSCPDWPSCYGSLWLSDDADFKNQAKASFPNAAFDLVKARADMSYRYLTAFLLVSLCFLFGFSWLSEYRRTTAVIGSFALLVIAGSQLALSWWMLTLKITALIVSTYFTLSFLSFWLLFWLWLRGREDVGLRSNSRGPCDLAWLGMFLVIVQVLLGSWLSYYDTASVCGDGFPLCQGAWIPQVILEPQLLVNAVNELLVADSSNISTNAKLVLHWLHRAGAIISLFILLIIAVVVSVFNYPKEVKRGGFALLTLLLAQIGLSTANVLLVLPLWGALAHHLIAALLMLPLLYISFYAKYVGIVVGLDGEIEAEEEEDEEEEIEEEKEDGLDNTSRLLDESVAVKIPTYQEPVAKDQQKSTALYQRLKTQLKKTRSGLGEVLASVSLSQKTIDDELLEEIENSLIIADVGFDASSEIIEKLTEKVSHNQLNDTESLITELKQQLIEIVEPCSETLQIPKQDTPFVILVVGINGVGKTTTIGKLAKRFKSQGHSVMLAAGDTFRAAAVEQLQTWGERNEIQVVAQNTGADSASVIYDAVQSAKAKNIDVLIADTAGRLHTKSHLMDELEKVKRIMGKIDPAAPHEILLVLDGGTGQNALSQAENFNKFVPLTGLVITKLDGTAKGGVIFALAKQFGIPIRFIGVGENIDDLQEFHATSFVDALLEKDD